MVDVYLLNYWEQSSTATYFARKYKSLETKLWKKTYYIFKKILKVSKVGKPVTHWYFLLGKKKLGKPR